LVPDRTPIIRGAEPIDLRGHAWRDAAWRDTARREGARAPRAMLLIHGFGDTPQTLRALASDLYESGYDVRVPLLPGHGRSVASFDAATHDVWIGAVRTELAALRAKYEWVGLGGLSMGGALAAIVAADIRDLPVLVLMAPYVAMPLYIRAAAACHTWWTPFRPQLAASSPDSIHDPVERAKNLAYGHVTGHALHELAAVARLAQASLPRVTAPTLLIQSRHDNRIAERVAKRAFAALGAARKELVLTDVGGHILTVDYGKERVFETIRAWLEDGPGTISSTPDASIVSAAR